VAERKPPGVSFETWIDRQIREAQERGEFDNLPGKGKKIRDLGEHHDELWWIRQLVQRENISVTPPTLKLRKDLESTMEAIAAATDESVVRDLVAAINVRIRNANRLASEGPPSHLMAMNVEEVVARWRQRAETS
jgi:hypothetical protein